MKSIDILLQGEGIADIQLIQLPEGASAADVLQEAAKRHAVIDPTSAVFVQDQDAPLGTNSKLPRAKGGQPLQVHVSRCQKVKVDVMFNGQTLSVALAPGRTVGSVKTYVAHKLFDMSPHDAAEHVLQLAGIAERPDVDTHIGSLAANCAVAFDLVPLVRVEG